MKSEGVKYKYDWQEGLTEARKAQAPCANNQFCLKMMEAQKTYSLAEINKLSEYLGYNVWKEKGGDGCLHCWVRVNK